MSGDKRYAVNIFYKVNFGYQVLKVGNPRGYEGRRTSRDGESKRKGEGTRSSG